MYISDMKTLLPLFLLVLFHSAYAQTISKLKSDSLVVTSKAKVKAVDKYEFNHRKEIITFVKLVGKAKLIKVKNENWPDDTEYIYNVLRDTIDKVILTEQIPYSQSGDWYVEFKHYYNGDGSVFAFGKRETVFDDRVKDGVAILSLSKFYDASLYLIHQSMRLTDIHEKPLKAKKQDFNFRNDKYIIYKNLSECLAAYHIQL